MPGLCLAMQPANLDDVMVVLLSDKGCSTKHDKSPVHIVGPPACLADAGFVKASLEFTAWQPSPPPRWDAK